MDNNTTTQTQNLNTQSLVMVARRQPNQAETIDMLALAMAILEKWVYLLLAIVIGAGIGFAVHRLTVTPSYKADAEVYITNTDKIVDLSSLNISDKLADDYMSFFQSRTVLKNTIEDLQLDITYQQLDKLISLSNPDGTHILEVYVTTKDPDSSVAICNALIQNGIEEAIRITGGNQPTVINYSEADSVELVEASLLKYIAIGAFLGALVVCGWVTLIFITDTTLKTDDDIEKYLGLSVIAFVPDFSEDHRSKGYGKAYGENREKVSVKQEGSN